MGYDPSTTGGCDGSIILRGELHRDENKGLASIASYVHDLATKYNVGIADMIVFVGNHAIVTCPGDPRVSIHIGRIDSSTPAPHGLLPDIHAPAESLYQIFVQKGFTALDLAALLGAHSTSSQFNFNTSSSAVGLPQDSTPGIWDVAYYSETPKPTKGIVVFPSDAKLAVYAKVGPQFKAFVNGQNKWNGKFASAMGKMTLFESDGSRGLVSCTDALPRATNTEREMRRWPAFAARY